MDRTGLYFTLVNSFLSADEAAYIVNDCGAAWWWRRPARGPACGRWHGAAGVLPNVERWLLVGAESLPVGTDLGPYVDFATASRCLPRHARARRAGGHAHGLFVGHHRPAEGHPPAPHRARPHRRGPALLQGARTFRYREGMVYLSPAPLYHSAPQPRSPSRCTTAATTIVMERFDAALFLEPVERHRVTHAQLVPTMFTRVLQLPDDVRAAYDVSSLEAVVHAAAPCPVPVKQAMIDWWGPILYEYYAATEAIGGRSSTRDDWLAHPGHASAAPCSARSCICDDDGRRAACRRAGHRLLRAVAADFEYHNDPDKTAGAKGRLGRWPRSATSATSTRRAFSSSPTARAS